MANSGQSKRSDGGSAPIAFGENLGCGAPPAMNARGENWSMAAGKDRGDAATGAESGQPRGKTKDVIDLGAFSERFFCGFPIYDGGLAIVDGSFFCGREG